MIVRGRRETKENNCQVIQDLVLNRLSLFMICDMIMT